MKYLSNNKEEREAMAKAHWIPIKPLSVNEALTVAMMKKGRRTYGRIIKTLKAKNFQKNVYCLLPKEKDIILYDKMILQCYVYFTNGRSDLDNSIKYFQDTLQKKYGFDDHRIYKLIITKILVEDPNDAGFNFMIHEFKPLILGD